MLSRRLWVFCYEISQPINVVVEEVDMKGRSATDCSDFVRIFSFCKMDDNSDTSCSISEALRTDEHAWSVSILNIFYSGFAAEFVNEEKAQNVLGSMLAVLEKIIKKKVISSISSAF